MLFDPSVVHRSLNAALVLQRLQVRGRLLLHLAPRLLLIGSVLLRILVFRQIYVGPSFALDFFHFQVRLVAHGHLFLFDVILRFEVWVEEDVILFGGITAVVFVALLLLVELKLFGFAVCAKLAARIFVMRVTDGGGHLLTEGTLVSPCITREASHVGGSFNAVKGYVCSRDGLLGGGFQSGVAHVVVHHVFIDVVVFTRVHWE